MQQQVVNGTSADKAYRKRSVAPPVDVYENLDELLLVVDVPGIAGDAISLEVNQDELRLVARARTRTRTPESESPALMREWREVDYESTFRVPAGVDAAKITAESKNGALRIRLPKTEKAKPRAIPVKTG
jgi:HSP20 family molecular chaperone IbpA